MTTQPTSAQLLAAGLVSLTRQLDFETALKNGYPLRRFDGTHFPELLSGVYVSKDWNTPIVPPTPTPSGYPSGLIPPLVSSGYTRAVFEDFLTTNSPILAGGYGPGAPGGTHGFFNPSHVVQNGDSILRLQFYSDGAGVDGGDINGGGGTQTDQSKYQWKPGTKIYVARRCDAHPSVVGILLLMAVGGHWPAEMDFCEGGMGWVHWDVDNKNRGFQMPSGTDESQWHIWGCEYLTNVINFTLNGNIWATMTNPTTDPTNVNGLLWPMFLSFQIQDGDPGYPTTAIPYTNRVEQQIDWVTIDVPV